MRKQLLSAVVVALLGSTSASAGDSMSLNQFPHRVEPVLVRVDAAGKVTQASPAYELSPKMTRLLQDNLSEMIRKPATDKHGKPVSSQFIMNMALLATPNGSGSYEAYFTYVSTKPVPPGSWYWVHLDGDRLALASQDMFRFGRDRHRSVPVSRYGDGYRPTYRGSSQPMPASMHAPAQATQSTSSNAPAHTR
ncbi:hypothetical protein [Rhodanobacter geophilus]|uniref:Uncharacterized protein n=1 Tax=Rhodanobacter geophilus TaxID=3162488 RepID=A0ABV3QSJ4_9GAMM